MTRSRIAIIIVSFSLITFLWTFGLPHPLAQPSLPVIDHYEHVNVHTDPIIPRPVAEKTYAIAPEPSAHRTRLTDKVSSKGQDVHIQTAAPSPTGVPEFEEDGGRWEDSSQFNATNAKPKAPTTEQSTTHKVEDFCKDAPGAQHVMVILRTSKAEISDKLPTNLHNLISCVPNFAIFSDHAGEIDGYKVHNALDSIGSEVKRTHDEFREYQIMHADAEHKPNPQKTKDLDKWKFLPMVYKAYHLRPSARFFIFIEADTSLSWTNFLQWVNRLDYRIPYHSGAPTFMNGIQLAQRGSGIMLSQGALRRYVKSYQELYTSKWEEGIGKECCGDLVLAMALNDAHVELYSSWPLLQNEQPSTLDYSQKHWCVPAVSWHHVVGDDLRGMWELERNWTNTHGWSKPYLFRDAFHDYVKPRMEAQKENWDNLSQDTKILAPEGRQQQMKEEAERRKQHQEAEKQTKKEDGKGQNKISEEEAADKKKAEEEKSKHQQIEAKHNAQATASKGLSETKEQKREEGMDWDKLAEKFSDAGDSSERCQKACTDTEDCLQWRYTTNGDGECHLGKVLRLGTKTNGDEKWTSGWLVERVKKVEADWKCKQANWNFYQ